MTIITVPGTQIRLNADLISVYRRSDKNPDKTMVFMGTDKFEMDCSPEQLDDLIAKAQNKSYEPLHESMLVFARNVRDFVQAVNRMPTSVRMHM